MQVRILVIDPPAGVRFAVQRGSAGLLEPSLGSHDVLRFDVLLRLGAPRPDGSVNFVGEFAQGPPADRFIYLNAGTLAGQADSPWTRRAKLKLDAIPRALVEAALAAPGSTMEARVQGTLADGGPVCASVKSHAVAWRLVREAA